MYQALYSVEDQGLGSQRMEGSQRKSLPEGRGSLPGRVAGMTVCLGDGQARLFSHEFCQCSVEI